MGNWGYLARGWRRALSCALPWLLAIALLAGCAGGARSVRAHSEASRASSTRPAVNLAQGPSFLSAAEQANLARNWRMGCLGGRPAPLGHAIRLGLNVSAGRSAPNEVALTFDDGPSPYSTPPILDYLEKTQTPATFFVIGEHVQQWPELLQREWRSGFAIGVHTWSHPFMTRLSYEAAHAQLADTIHAIDNALGGTPCIWFWRPPYMDQNASVIANAASLGLTTIDWDDDSRDWTLPGAQVIANTVLAEAHPGAIIIMHDGPANREETLTALPLILAGLKARGLTPVTLPQLLADGGFTSVRLPSGPGVPLFRVPEMVLRAGK